MGLHQRTIALRLEASELAARSAEREVRALASRYETLLWTSSDGIHVLDESGRLVEANDAFCAQLGYSRGEVIGLSVADWDASITPDDVLSRLRGVMGVEPIVFEARHRRKDGALIDVEIIARGVTLDGRSMVYASARDITARKGAERERVEMVRRLLIAKKHESLGIMAAGVAHNFNNLFTVVLGNLLMAEEDATPDQGPLLQDALVATRRAAEISGFMLTYLGQAGAVPGPVDTAKELRQLVSLVVPLLPPNVRLEADIAADTPACIIDPHELQQLVLGIVTNAWEAAGVAGGTVRLVACAYVAEGRAEDGVGPPASSWVRIAVHDDGVGMDAGTLERAFDPFFTTKFTGRGTGLAAAQGIVHARGGTITLDSALSRGTVATVLLPANAAEAPRELARTRRRAGTPKGAAVSPAGSLGPVLLVDDDLAVSAAMARFARKLGYEPTVAHDGPHALAEFDAKGGAFVAVVLDLSMPGMDGWAVLGELRRRSPSVYVIIASAFDVARLEAEDRAVKPDAWMQKPCALDELGAALAGAAASRVSP